MTRTLAEEAAIVVAEVYAEEGRPATGFDVVYTLGYETRQAGQALKRAVYQGLIDRVCRGRYIPRGHPSAADSPELLLAYRVRQVHAYAEGREVTLRELDAKALGGVGYHAARRAILASDLVCVRVKSSGHKVYALP